MLQSLRRVIRQHKTTGSFVIKRQLSPRAKLLIVGTLGAAALGAVLFIYEYGLNMAGFERALAARVQRSLQDDNQRFTEENQQLREALARAERTIQMDQAAYQELDRTLQASAQEIVKLREELNFYRNIISPTDKKAGLRVQSLDIQQTGSSNVYRYKLVLIQALKHERSVLGTANLEIRGTLGGQGTTVKVPAQNERPIQINLKYFQDIEGKFELPKGFRPQSMKVNVITGGGAHTAEAIYEWPHG